MTVPLNESINLLLDALNQPSRRSELIKQFQQLVWNIPKSITEVNVWAWDTLQELAYDLDFYEPNAGLRSEDSSYFGDERVEEEIKSTLKKLKEGGISFP